MSWIAQVVAASCRRPLVVAVVGLLIGAAALVYTSGHFALTADTAQLISPKLAWRQNSTAFDKAFPQNDDVTVAVIDGATPEVANSAAARLASALAARTDLFKSVRRPDSGPFFDKEGLLLLPQAQVQATVSRLLSAQAFLGPLASDPSLRGVMTTLSTVLLGVQGGQAKLSDLDKPMTALTGVFDKVLSNQPAFFSWQALFSGPGPASPNTRQFVLVRPKLDYAALMPGKASSEAIRQIARGLDLDPAHGTTLRLTGSVPLADDQFGSLLDRAWLMGAAMLASILVMLWLAVRSVKIVAAILATTFLGLVITAGVGLFAVHRFNLISVAFIPLFVGLGVDFGMIIAFGLAVTFLPAMLALLRPRAETAEVGFAALGPLDVRLIDHRRQVLLGFAGAAVVCLALVPFLRFDFNPLHLQNPNSEPLATLNDMMRDPQETPNTIDVLEPSLAQADAVAKRLDALPEVDQALTLSTFIPTHQDEKLAILGNAALLLGPTLNPIVTEPAPSDGDVVQSLRTTARALDQAASAKASSPAAAADARGLADALQKLADAAPAVRMRAANAVTAPLVPLFDQLRLLLQAQPTTRADLPPELVREWTTPDGRARISVFPKGDSNNNRVLVRFSRAVRRVAPNATGTPISIQEAGATIQGAFVEAFLLSFIATVILLWIVLRRVRDVALTMAPIILTGLLTLATCVLVGQPINFADIIAFPLLFGIGVAFNIYFVIAWRKGETNLLQSSLTRAVLFSALTTGASFGSLALSAHPGTASMGRVLMISLAWILVTALLFEPALLGPPPQAPLKSFSD